MEHDEQNGMDLTRIGRYIAGIVGEKRTRQSFMLPAHSINS